MDRYEKALNDDAIQWLLPNGKSNWMSYFPTVQKVVYENSEMRLRNYVTDKKEKVFNFIAHTSFCYSHTENSNFVCYALNLQHTLETDWVAAHSEWFPKILWAGNELEKVPVYRNAQKVQSKEIEEQHDEWQRIYHDYRVRQCRYV